MFYPSSDVQIKPGAAPTRRPRTYRPYKILIDAKSIGNGHGHGNGWKAKPRG